MLHQRRYADTEALMRRVLAMMEARYATGSPDAVKLLRQRATLCAKLERRAEAAGLRARAAADALAWQPRSSTKTGRCWDEAWPMPSCPPEDRARGAIAYRATGTDRPSAVDEYPADCHVSDV